MKVLLVGLAALLVASLAATLGVGAQTNGDEVPDGAIEGRVIVRIQDRTGADGTDNYRIEFGFLPQWAMDERDPWSEAVTTFSELLPRARYLTKATIDARRDSDNRRWLRSSPISVPALSTAQAESALSGRVIARYSPHSRTGALRIEFGFLPEGAFTSTADTQEAVEQYGEQFLPRARYLTASMITDRRGVWLRSSLITVIRIGAEPAPVIDSISCSPKRPAEGQDVACSASLSGGTPTSWEWDGGEAVDGKDAETFRTRFRGAREHTVSLTVRNAAGSDSKSITVTVNTPPEAVGSIADVALEIDGSERVDVGPNFRDADGDALTYDVDSDSDAVVWSRIGSAVTLEGASAGSAMVTVTATDPHGASATQSFRVTVGSGPQVPVIDNLNCTPSEPRPEQTVTCTAQLSGGELDRWDWSDSDGGSSGCTRTTWDAQVWECSDSDTLTEDSSESYSTTFSQAGRQTVSLTVRNSAGSDSESVTVTVNTPPEAVGSIADVALEVDGSERVDVGPNFRDADGDRLTYGVNSDNGAVIWSSIGSIFTLEGVSAGSAMVTVTATDPHGASATQAFRVTINGPLAIACSPPAPTVNQPVICTASLSGGTATSYSWSGGASSGSDLIYRTTFRSAGDHTVSVTVRDSAGRERQSSLTITVNTPPEPVGSISDVTVGVDGSETIDASGSFRDDDGDQLTYEADSDGSAVRASVSGSSVTVVGVRAGSATVTVTADDGNGGTATQSFRVSVTEALAPSCTLRNAHDDGRELTETVDLRQHPPGTAMTFMRITLECTDPSGSDDDLTITSSSGNDSIAWVRGLGSSYTTIRAGATAGATTLTFTATAPDGRAGSIDASVIVRPVTAVESVSCSPSRPEVGQSVTCTATLSGSMPDSYSWSGGASSGTSATYQTSFSTAGDQTVTLTVRNDYGNDGSNSHSGSTTVTVSEAPIQPPVIDSISCTPSSPKVNDTVTCTASLSGGTPDSYSWSGGASAGSESTYSTSFGTSGSQTVSLTVTNTAGSDSGSASVTVEEEVNQAPECLSISGLSPIALGGRGSARFRCSDPDGSPESISVTVASDDSNIVEASLATGDGVVQIIGTLRSTRLNFRGLGEGSTTIRATATDAEGASTTITFSVTVTAPPAPEINISCTPSTVATNTSVSCEVSSNSGGAISTHAWSGGPSNGSGASYSPSWSSAGSKTVSLTASNAGGSDSDSTSVTVMIPPSISSLGCPSSATVNQAISCSPTVTGTGPLTYSWSGGDSDSGQSGSTYSPSWSSAGSETVSLTVRNSVGSDDNRTEVTITGGGNRAPTCTVADELGREVTSVEVETFSGTRVVATCTDPDEDELTLTPTSANTNTARITASLGRAGNNFTIQGQGAQGDLGTTTVTISATDPGGLTGSVSISVTVRSTPPTMRGVASASVNVGGSVKVTQLSWDPDGDRFTATATSSNTNVARVSVDGTDFGTRTPPGHTALFSGLTTLTVTGVGVGTATITVRTTDVHGSGWPVGSGIRFDVTVQAAPPVVDAPEVNSISCTPSPVATNASVTCTVSLSDSGGTPDSYSWSGGSSSGSSSSYSPRWSSAGSKTVSLTVSNSGGSDSGSTTVVVMDPPSVSNVRCSPSSTQTNSSVSCSADVTGSTPLTYSWSGGDSRGSSSSYSPSWSSAGSKTVSLTVRNAVGSDSSAISGNITVTPEPPRSIRIRCTAYVLQGNSASCSVSRNRGGPISTHSWSGGDSSGSSSTYSPSWSSYGQKTVSLTASNAGGNDSDSLPVDVVATAPTYARCGSDTIKVYYFERETLTKRHLNMTWEEVAARVPGWGEHMIGHLSQSACDSWPTGTDVTTINWPLR